MSTAPKRILILSILLIIFSIIGLISNLYSVLAGSLPLQTGFIPPTLTVVLNIIGGIITIICAIGFLKRKNKFRLFYTGYMLLTSLFGIISILTLTPPAELTEQISETVFKSMSILFLIIIVILPLIILYTKKSNKWFSLSSILENNKNVEHDESKIESE